MDAKESDRFQCPVCDGSELVGYRGRRRARCALCGAFERSRLLQLVLEGLDFSRIEGHVLHLAPEIGIAQRLSRMFGDRYVACDLDPAIYTGNGFTVRQLDVCRDLRAMARGSVGCVIHVHVLEHVRCSAADVLAQFGRILSSGGYHIFGLPFAKGHYREDQSPGMSAEQRRASFGQDDHVRVFGTEDFDTMFGPVLREHFDEVEVRSVVDARRLSAAAIPLPALAGYSPHSIQILKKRS